MTNKNLLSFLQIFIFFNLIFAQTKVTDNIYIDAEFRPRLEFDQRNFAATGFDSYATYRTRVGISFQDIVENTTVYLQLADSRLMGFSDPYLTGQNAGPNKWDNNIGVTKAFIEVKDIFGNHMFLKIGRMSNNQGRNRIFGPGNWNLYGPRTYDGVKIGQSREKISWNVWNFWGIGGDRHWNYLQDSPGKFPNQNIPFKADHTLTGFDLSAADGKINLLTFLDLDQMPVADTLNHKNNVAFSRLTMAANIKWRQYSSSGIWFDFDAVYQFGKQAHGSGNGEISAYLVAADISYHLQKRHNPWLGFGFDITSGDDGQSPEKINDFYEFYFSKHTYQGNMDFFSNNSGIKSLGLQDFIVRAGFNPMKNLKFKLDFHHFQTQKSFISKVDQTYSTKLGQELDLTLDYLIRKGLKTRFGFDIFWPSEDWQGKNSQKSIFSFLTLTAFF